ncbi:AAA-like domain-containing protein [Microcoleus sp. FACHB-1515]|uniref:AAA-like domain-containing protein n=1 Tax=Cyanophyceae TaxID=3028117 RepID=UPI0016866B17|nr:AAA-like domain-containing protein [Microcoleus sp. FACHB-1515]MBD2091565.1 AAA-like domain-containing protein [Microcoleus sp. FACHB-1515]
MNGSRWTEATSQPKRRQRGVVLTPSGLQRLQAAIALVEIEQNQGDRFTLEELGNRINLSTKTLTRLWSLNSGVDQRTLRLCFSAFNLELHKEDYALLSELDEPEPVRMRSRHAESEPMPYPNGPEPLDSPFYIGRPPIETLAYQEVTQPGCVIRIRAPKEMGKSSLMLRLVDFAEAQGYRIVTIDCNQIDASCLTDLQRFLRSFCLRVARELDVEPRLDEHWDDEIGSKLSCTFYLKNYLLKQIDSPIVLLFNEIDRFFEHPEFAQEFFPLLRSWYEDARRNVNLQKLRLVVIYSTEEYVSLNINQSPFNVGLPLRLPEFTPQQVQDLVERHGLNWGVKEVEQLIALVGGHPALIRIALYHVCTQQISLEQVLQGAIENGGIFQNHLWHQWVNLQKNPSLVEALAVMLGDRPDVAINPIQTYKLESQGLIRREGEHTVARCELYRIYFKQQLLAFQH